ncbi:Protocadherin alpha-6 [Fukomys damarensis]|uniref:Protocadherin alpha-6 n=1 Tax=Fukomys damarensis TaxID=885580 RepID=A0A091CP53_FUKDA|nr:Protocadherin alpha-6 [Fukomys damarensis]
MLFARAGGLTAWRLLLSLLHFAAWEAGSGQLHYSVPEEAKHGTFVGRIAQDLGLELAELVPRLFRVASKERGDLLEVNLQNGILFVNSRVDREELCGRSAECSIHLEVIVDRPLQIFHVEVKVEDINDNPPVFRGRQQRIFIPENRQLGSRFPIEGAVDADTGANALLIYNLSPNDYFSLDVQASDELSKSLSLELKKSLDREATPELHLLLTATDGGKPELEDTVQLMILVLDVNDNAPVFAQALYRVHLLETVANGTLVTTLNASDADKGVNGEIVFSFGNDGSPNIKEKFKIDSSSGEIRLIDNLDYEEAKSYEIQIKAVDKGSPPMSSHCKVLVKVLDVNDNTPEVVITSRSLPIREDAPFSTIIALIAVSDRDSGVNGEVTCSLTPHVPFKLVSTFKNYYSLVLDSALDRESASDYEVVVTARDGGSPSLWTTATVLVMVSSLRRGRGRGVRQCLLQSLLLLAAWEAGSGQLHYSIPEEAKHGTFVGRIAQDLGLELAELVPRLFRVASKERGDLLEVNLQNGILFVNSRVDREELCGRSAECSIHLEVIVDRPLQVFHVEVEVFHVEVEVKDINDNPPVFPKPVKTLWFPELRLLDSRFPLEGASDPDIGVNALLSYKLSSNEFFFLDIQTNDEQSQSLFLVQGKFLDREETAELNLLLVATDGGKPELTGTIQILIKVLDVNDNEPTFDHSVYKVQLSENTANGTLVIKVNASDADEGSNSDIVYSLSDVSSNTEKFKINPHSGEIKTKGKLDYEEMKSYDILVIASDKGTPPMSGHCKISLKLVDINDNTPEISISSLSLPIQENAPLGTVIALITVSDHDSGINGQVTCSLTPHAPFKLVSTFKNYYSLVLDSALDRESASDYEVVVTARDGGSPSLSGHLHYSVPEEAKHGTFVGRIAQDLGLELAELVPRLFRVASKERGDLLENGILFVNSRVDREELCGRSAECSIHLEVIVDRPLQVFHVEVEVKDINDNPPRFSREEQRLLILESRMPDSRFPVEGASDLDIGENAELKYRVNPNEYFDLDVKRNEEETNVLQLILKKPLDREEAQEHCLVLIATDGGKPALTGTVQLLINVLDANDNAPEFEKSVYNVRLLENTQRETLVIKLNASDADEGINKEIDYFFSNMVLDDVKSKFMINSNNGEIRVKGELDYENRNLYEINIDAVDRSAFPLTGHCKVIVKLLDVNDNTPEIAVTSLFLPIKEDAPIGTVIALISVSDRDSGANGQVTCSLKPPIPFKLVSSFKNYYSLVLDSALDRESASGYEVVVTARDGGSPSLWTTATVSVEVADVNDNAPVFAQAEYTVFVKENNPPGSPILTSRRSDSKTLQLESLVQFNECCIQEINKVNEKKEGLQADFEEVWKAGSGQLHYSIPEEAKHGTFVGRIAQDLGLELAELVPRLFRVASKERGDLLEVNLQNGILFVNSRVDREELCGRSAECSIHLEVIVDRPLQVFHVEVEVKDINDNPPVFPGKEQKLFVSESRMLDSRLPLEGASDADVGSNSILTYKLSSKKEQRLLIYESRLQHSLIPLEGASDADVGSNSILTYKLSSNEYFGLDVKTNNYDNKQIELVLRKSLDREEAPKHNLLLTATDGGKPELTGSVQLLITVLDVNDHAPAFDQPEYEVRIFENSDVGTTVIRLSASDRDAGTNAAISYSFNSLVLPLVMDRFSIDPSTGEIVIRGDLDFEQVNLYKIRVDATDKGHPPMAGHCTVIVQVLDENDNVPKITLTSLSLPVEEDAQIGRVIALISVSDRDSGVNGEVTCSLTPHVPFKLVSTFKNYYSLVLDSALDRESASDYEVVVTARDGGSPSLWTTATVSVEVADVNDNAPVFAQAEYTVFVKENNPPGSPILTVCARDADAQENARVSYSLVERRIELVLRKSLDREEAPKHNLLLTATDGGKPELTGSVQLLITVLDVNDHAPAFDQPEYEVRIFENSDVGTTVIRLSASDRDAGTNAAISYSFNSLVLPLVMDRFSIDPSSGEIVIRGDLDFEQVNLYKIRVDATDKGHPPMAGHCTVIVQVLDENDNVPKITLTSLSLPVEEDAQIGRVIALISVSDRDSGVNGEVTCSLTPHVPFKLVSTFKNYYSLVLDSALDRESASDYEVVVTARDGGSPSLWTTATVSVEVADVNDNAPVFAQAEYTVFVKENNPPGSPILTVCARDADAQENARVSYSLVERRVKPLGLVLRKPLDREEAPELYLLLTATDGGKPELTGSVQVIITVLDANDNAPVFHRTLYTVKLPEDVSIGTLVINANASDADEGVNGEIIYAFSSDVSPDIKSKFHIDAVSGEITVIGLIDFEESKTYKIQVEAVDKGSLPQAGHCTVLVEVVDVNDNAPQLTVTSLSLPVSEDTQLDTVITLISVFDRDSGVNGQVTCSLMPDVPFKLISTFKNYYSLVLDSALDRESSSGYEVVVTSRDGGSPSLWTTATVSVEVADVNDNAPVFAQAEYTVQDFLVGIKRILDMVFSWQGGLESQRLLLLLLLLAAWEAGSGHLHYSVPEEAKHGTFVGRIAQDLGLELAELVPRLFRVASKERGDLLEVNLQNGILFVNSRVDREELCGRSAECSIHLEVIVDRPLQVFHVEVEVKDINDNPPVFPAKEQRLLIYESRLQHSLIPLEGASDADVGSNSILTYKLSSNEYFGLDVKTNNYDNKQIELVLRKSLDREEAPKHNLLLTATDGGKPELTGSVQLLITVLDVNDHAPAFDQPEYEVRIFENSDVGTTVIRLSASDRDAGTNAAISYSFNSLVLPLVMDRFSIDPSSGEIVIRGDLDFEQVNLYKIRVDATDKGHPPMAGHCTVIVQVLDENDNVPKITLTSLSLPVEEDAQIGRVIALISVSDRDSGVNGEVTCSLTPHVPFKLVSTFKNYYSLVLDSALDRESASDYEVVVTARDGGSPSLWTTATVSVEVADVNDNAPVFAQAEYTVFVKENNPPGSPILTVCARDADAQENARVSYSLVERRAAVVDVNVYLIIAICAVSSLLVLTLLLYTALRCSAAPTESACGPGKPTLVCSSAVGSWSYSQQKGQRVCSGEGLPKTDPPKPDLMAFSPSLPPCPEPGNVDKLQGYTLEDGIHAPKASSRTFVSVPGSEAAVVDVNVYLIIAICAVSSLLVLTLLLYTVLRCSAAPTESACGPGKPTLVCSSAVGSWSYSQQRGQRVCSGEGPPKTDLMAFSPSLPPCPESTGGEAEVPAVLDSSGKTDTMLAAKSGDQIAKRHLLQSLLFVAAWGTGSGQLHYSVPEEAKHGTFVGRIAQDLGLELAELVPRLFRVASKERGDLLEVNLQNGILFVNSRVDREELCGRSAECSIHLEVIVDRPLQVFHVEVEVKDINDNPPVFPATQKNLLISETRALDSRFSLEGAWDADVGANSILTYRLSPNEYFSLEVPTKEEQVKPLELVLKRPLDREIASELLLVLRATDGGKPELSGTVELLITVLDVNDNAPVFDRAIYPVKLLENTRNGTLVIRPNASDLDEGSNSHIVYSFANDVSPKTENMFYIDSASGEIKVNGQIDFEETRLWKIQVEAVDKGNPPMFGHCTILIEVLDINDNAPELVVTSLSLPVQEDAPVGTVIALISVSDRDSGVNAQVTCSLMPDVPFKLVSTFKNYYSLVLDSALDRESASGYEVVVTARDGGSPSLWTTATVSVEVADVNDNAPVFAQAEYTQRGQRVCSGAARPKTDLMAFSPGVSPGSGSGDGQVQQQIFENISTTRALDQEDAPRQRLLVLVRDHGEPALTATATVLVSLVESGQAPKASLRALAGDSGPEVTLVDVNVYLIIAICAVSSLLVLTLLLYTALRCSAAPTESACGPGKPTLVCSSAVGSWSYSQQRGQRVCSGEGPPKTDLMAFSPSLPPCLDRDEREKQESGSNHPGQVKVTARNGGSPSLWTTATVSVEVADVNDNAPVFAQAEYTVFVKENNPPGSPILTPLDHEELELLRFQVSARDSGAPPLGSTVTVQVFVLDENDNAPVLLPP